MFFYLVNPVNPVKKYLKKALCPLCYPLCSLWFEFSLNDIGLNL